MKPLEISYKKDGPPRAVIEAVFGCIWISHKKDVPSIYSSEGGKGANTFGSHHDSNSFTVAVAARWMICRPRAQTKEDWAHPRNAAQVAVPLVFLFLSTRLEIRESIYRCTSARVRALVKPREKSPTRIYRCVCFSVGNLSCRSRGSAEVLEARRSQMPSCFSEYQ